MYAYNFVRDVFQHNNPYILAMVNDGMKQYDHNT